ncbi:MAG: hypothetical protein OEO77_04135 [Acidimicrobiia bacterium]|nr:hypothetical protein [Acidimicrobiia bacterium]
MDIEERVLAELDALGADYEALPCDPALADTAAFCAHYGYSLDESANAILIASRRPPGELALVVALAATSIDVNRAVRDAMGVKKLSFAPQEVTAEATGMLIGGVTPFGLPDGVPVLVDAAVLEVPKVIVGGGSRALKIRLDPEVFARLSGARVVPGLAR